ncbi:RNA-directed DNA polymerase [Vibrio parahaemolyticus]|uniref:reverse transcriptase family protein n=2 Tax=Vibrio parahaemolyticus TaxID=670 RepID=UPI0003F78EEE|nr:reverse transcriptase family protein [Vibrio parahaemolyticus]EGQ8165018.1 RNA-directed DNA polymerase [Vibrio parahaemolyticus]EGQ8167051.1 RNA-directed DNA polymerase [Vibrio parahaemolyticus]EGR0996418.1 RNA-directed DNA polymerase [Vibrio parahaemolyticus]EGR3438798.1 RNA-directed DNA polymerase [Vibrio parahaemolyticus]EGR3441980.1 RNA-directed DNA polymerase [Vibrio parahaemolyticus]
MYLSQPSLNTKNAINSMAALEKTLGLTAKEIQSIISLPESQKYFEKKVPKSDGSIRLVYCPHPQVRRAQRKINNNIFKKLVKWPSYIFGSIPNTKISKEQIEKKDYISCAGQHCGAKSLLKMDIKSFFDNIHFDHVLDMFVNFFHYDKDVSFTLAKLCCKSDYIVQGGLTSSYVASLILWRHEPELVKRLQRKNLTYTRLVDDISISSHVSNFDFSMVQQLVTNMLYEIDLPVNNDKTKVYHLSTEPLTIHGIRVNFNEPRLPANEVRKIRAAVHNLTILASQPGYRTLHSYREDYARCMGRVNKLKRVQHEKHSEFLKTLQNIRPLPSEKDLKRARVVYHRLMRNYSEKKDTRGYRTSFFKLQERLNVLCRKKCFREEAQKIRRKLKEIAPSKQAKENF